VINQEIQVPRIHRQSVQSEGGAAAHSPPAASNNRQLGQSRTPHRRRCRHSDHHPTQMSPSYRYLLVAQPDEETRSKQPPRASSPSGRLSSAVHSAHRATGPHQPREAARFLLGGMRIGEWQS
jgi:hypothetical protein